MFERFGLFQPPEEEQAFIDAEVPISNHCSKGKTLLSITAALFAVDICLVVASHLADASATTKIALNVTLAVCTIASVATCVAGSILRHEERFQQQEQVNRISIV